MNWDDTADMIKAHEGHKCEVYLDTEGIPTVGYGHALHIGSEIPHQVCEMLFRQDFRKTIEEYESLCLSLDTVRRAVVVDMIFNLGLKGFMRFAKLRIALVSGDYEEAAREMIDSKWYRQVGSRAKELVKMMETGEY